MWKGRSCSSGGTALCVNWSCLLLRRIKHLTASPGFILSPSAEIEAKEACTWLRAAGFPQYAQLYEGNRQTDRPPMLPPQAAIIEIQIKSSDSFHIHNSATVKWSKLMLLHKQKCSDAKLSTKALFYIEVGQIEFKCTPFTCYFYGI